MAKGTRLWDDPESVSLPHIDTIKQMNAVLAISQKKIKVLDKLPVKYFEK